MQVNDTKHTSVRVYKATVVYFRAPTYQLIIARHRNYSLPRTVDNTWNQTEKVTTIRHVTNSCMNVRFFLSSDTSRSPYSWEPQQFGIKSIKNKRSLLWKKAL